MKIEDKVDAIGNLPQGDLNLGTVLMAVYALAGLTAVGFVIFGGYQFIRSEGDHSKVQQAQQMIFWAIAGLVVVIFAAAITNFAISGFQGAKG